MLKVVYLKEYVKRCHSLHLRHFSKKAKKDAKKYTSTIKLPKTKFQVWIQPDKRSDLDEHIQKVSNFAELYAWQREHINGEEYILHDGPPYANGLPHMGHAINKILKDITIRSKLLQGHKIHFKQGWDCHGLPIELLAVSNLDHSKEFTPIDIRKKAYTFACDAINNQRAVFKSWGILADCSNDGCYFTFNKDYIKNELLQFFNLYEKGLVYRDFKPVYWSPSSKTALAEAELEYNPEHISTAVTVAIRLKNLNDRLKNIIKSCSDDKNNSDLFAVLWTTTPWTLPANQAIAFNPSLDYSIIRIFGDTKLLIVATKLIDEFSKLINKTCSEVTRISVDDLSILNYEHPIISDKNQNPLPFIPSTHVTAEKGTGLVHIASAHGQDDFIIGKKNGFKIESIVDEDGKYTDKAGKELVGKFVLSKECTHKVLSCVNNDNVLNVEEFKHSYPYDWRTKQPVILRASQQWFIDTDNMKQKAVDALKDVAIVPEKNSSGFLSLLERRPYWCISRQRVWGVPIPVLYNKSDGTPVITKSLIQHYCKLLDSHGSNFWWVLALKDIVPESIVSDLKLDLNNVEKGEDILDIWLDSGLSWSYVLGEDKIADLYLEGVDQFTGWFQSSLMTSVALRGKAPYKTLFVHGFAVDDKGRKMSKSVGNVVNPQDIIYGGNDKKKQKPYGIDVLRWWVAGHSTQHINVPVSETLLSDSEQCVQKLRSVLRFILGGIHDIEPVFKSDTNSVTLHTLDRYLLHRLYHFQLEADNLYNKLQYNRVCSHIVNFIANEVSAVYVHLTKDRLYCDAENSNGRRAVQITMNHILNVILHVIAPIVPVLAEEVYLHHPLNNNNSSLFKTSYDISKNSWDQPEVEEIMKLAFDVRRSVIKEIPVNSNNWNLSAVLSLAPECYDILKVLQSTDCSNNSELGELLQLASVTIVKDSKLSNENSNNFNVNITYVKGNVCERCRRHLATLKDGDSDICTRCSDVLTNVNLTTRSDHKTKLVN